MSRKLIVNADDLGLCRAVNEAVEQAHRQGILTSASLMATGAAFEHAVDQVIRLNPMLGVGAHLCLTSGRSLLPPAEIPLLVNADGTFRHGFVSLLKLMRSGGQDAARQVERELEAQVFRIQAAGVAIDHLNSHRHVHMIPTIFEVVQRLSDQCGGPVVRVSTEPWFPHVRSALGRRLPRFVSNAPKNVVLKMLNRQQGDERSSHRVHRVYGILGSGCMDGATLSTTIRHLPVGVSELLTHPAIAVNEPLQGMDAGDRAFVSSLDRVRELEALVAPTLRTTIESTNTALVRFCDLP
ncbi:MAG: ChbG/HpnK family deacetylase [Planctomycetaceae bacterium]|nr:ChbG/HpnK family deacetylase [Planctomycetaceae bacterium]